MREVLTGAFARLSAAVPASLRRAEARGWGRGGLAPVVANPRTMAGAACLFFGSGAVLSLLLTLVPGLPADRIVLIRAIAAVPLLGGPVLVLLGHLVPAWMYHAMNVAGTAMVTLAVWLSGDPLFATAMTALYMFVPLDSYFFFRRRTATVYQLAGMLACLSTAWPMRLVAAPVALGMVAVMVVAAVIVAWLVRAAADGERDPLTGLVNRRGLERAVEDALALGDRTGGPFSVGYLDLDNFKALNDSAGHARGDTVLRAVATRWTDLLPPDATLARFGGDEFVVLLPGLDLAAAGPVLDRMRRATLHGSTASAGFAEWQPGDTASLLLGRADAALYQAKQAGRDRLHPPLHDSTTIGRLRQGLASGEVVVHFQPIVRLRRCPEPGAAPGGRTPAPCPVVGAEALARWRAPGGGLVPPDHFIPLAEGCGLIHELGRQVLTSACTQVAAADPEGHRLRHLSVNVSGRELHHPGYVTRLAQILRESGLAPQRLVLEVTESSLAADSAPAIEAMRAARELGVRIAVDDFGTGYSSLSRLEQLPVDVIKIDRSFVRRVSAGDPTPVITTILALASAMGLSVVAEGIERPEQANELLAQGCRLGQGWLFGRPALLGDLAPSGGGEVPAPRRS